MQRGVKGRDESREQLTAHPGEANVVQHILNALLPAHVHVSFSSMEPPQIWLEPLSLASHADFRRASFPSRSSPRQFRQRRSSLSSSTVYQLNDFPCTSSSASISLMSSPDVSIDTGYHPFHSRPSSERLSTTAPPGCLPIFDLCHSWLWDAVSQKIGLPGLVRSAMEPAKGSDWNEGNARGSLAGGCCNVMTRSLEYQLVQISSVERHISCAMQASIDQEGESKRCESRSVRDPS